MTATPRIATCVIAALPLVAGGDSVAIRFAPDEGTAWTKSFESSTQMEFASMSVVMDGNEVPSEYLPRFDIRSADSERYVFTDRYVALREGRPGVLRRRFDAIEVERNMDFEMSGTAELSRASHGSGTSGLEDAAVVFTWDEDLGEYEVEWAEEGGDDALLSGLAEDVDLRALLPEEPVEVGDSWEVAGEALAFLVRPGGDLHVELEGENLEDFSYPKYDEELDASASLRLVAVEEVDGARIAVVGISGLVTLDAEGGTDLDDVPVADGDATRAVTLEIEVEGELRWDVSAGMPRSLEVGGATRLTVVTTKDPGQPGGDFQSTLKMVGSFRGNLATERAK